MDFVLNDILINKTKITVMKTNYWRSLFEIINFELLNQSAGILKFY